MNPKRVTQIAILTVASSCFHQESSGLSDHVIDVSKCSGSCILNRACMAIVRFPSGTCNCTMRKFLHSKSTALATNKLRWMQEAHVNPYISSHSVISFLCNSIAGLCIQGLAADSIHGQYVCTKLNEICQDTETPELSFEEVFAHLLHKSCI